MPFYHRMGDVPGKRHSVVRRANGSVCPEELIGNQQFQGPSSLIYHLHRPTDISGMRRLQNLRWEPEPQEPLKLRHFLTSRLPSGGSFVLDRTPLLFNEDVAISIALPGQADDFFYRNAQADECLFVCAGAGVMESVLGELTYRAGDFLVVPRGILYRLRVQAPGHKVLVIESRGYIRTPKRYRNEHGQLTEMAPYSERDIRRPERLSPRDERGEFRLVVKQQDALHEISVGHHPFDVMGWDGFYYPFAFNIQEFESQVGRFQLPVPVHETFESDGFVIRSLCPRPGEFDPKATPAPYNHSNVMSDEVTYYVTPEATGRKGIEQGSVTLHPDGLTHGPQPDGESRGTQQPSREVAVMVEAYSRLRVTVPALAVEDADYWKSWQEVRQ